MAIKNWKSYKDVPVDHLVKIQTKELYLFSDKELYDNGIIPIDDGIMINTEKLAQYESEIIIFFDDNNYYGPLYNGKIGTYRFRSETTVEFETRKIQYQKNEFKKNYNKLVGEDNERKEYERLKKKFESKDD